MFFWTVRKENICIVFRDGNFVFNLWSWNRLYLGEEMTSLIGILERMGLKVRGGEVFCSSCFMFLSCLYASCIPCSMFFVSLFIYQKHSHS